MTLKELVDAGLMTRDNAQILCRAAVDAAKIHEESWTGGGYRIGLWEACEKVPHSSIVFGLLRTQWNETLELAPELNVPLWKSAVAS